ncbi:hypothetical protein [Ahrensia sp. 13_GOM-1096m]|uniref:hypothetical protein n=1 Tax=Ahrensia sp. 13_GOM-1096m TaxID=1380380 RepID=UPI00047B06EE|nr:hypothetical protein [Ahrensia sp. 13_GOM-1096m]
MFTDRVSEAIAHFIGLFELLLEQERARDGHDEFSKQEEDAEIPMDLEFSQYDSKASHQLTDLEADVKYKAPDHEIIELRQRLDVESVKFGSVSSDAMLGKKMFQMDQSNVFGGVSPLYLVPPIPGSIGLAVKQSNTLIDNDKILDSDIAFDYVDPITFENDLQHAALNAKAISALSSIKPPAFEDAIAEIVDEARVLAAQIDTSSNPLNASIDVVQSDTFSGIYVNGEITDEAPELSQILSPPVENEVDSETDNTDNVPSFDIRAGGNTSINEAVMIEAWIDAPVQMVRGDHVSLNIISQTNVLVDSDELDGVVSKVAQSDHSALVQNIAAFVTTSSAIPDAAAQVTASMPNDWSITVLEGNLILLNWLEQINYLVDNDVISTTASGSNVMMQTGNNLTLNSFSILELGYHYDLIIVGGDIYHANIINQINVLFDNDFVTTTTANAGVGGIASGGNALWNVASIEQTGIDTTYALSQAMMDGISVINSGDMSFQQGMASFSEFAEISHLNVLYISGSLLDLQYIKQVNVVGDADQVAIDLSNSGIDWDVETGDNTLLNLAAIVEVGVNSSVYVGGDIYSDALLYQAELIIDEPVFVATDTSHLASEAVLFLSDDMVDDTGAPDSDTIVPTPAEAPQVDIMQTMLA